MSVRSLAVTTFFALALVASALATSAGAGACTGPCIELVGLNAPSSVCPGAPFGPACTRIAGGDVAAATGLMAVLAGTSALLGPLLLHFLLPLLTDRGAIERLFRTSVTAVFSHRTGVDGAERIDSLLTAAIPQTSNLRPCARLLPSLAGNDHEFRR